MTPSEIARSFRVQEDDWSFQISCVLDNRFWFRLEKSPKPVDVITDYFLGEFESSLGGPLLAECYRTLGRVPQSVIVFRNLLPGTTPDLDATTAVADACERYAAYGAQALRVLRRSDVRQRRYEIDGKIDLELVAVEEAPHERQARTAAGGN